MTYRSPSHKLKLAIFVAALLASCTAITAEPKTKIQPAVDEYHGVAVADPYRWLENWQDPKVKHWSNAQNRHARAYLDALPKRTTIERNYRQILAAENISYRKVQVSNGVYFALQRVPPAEQPRLVSLRQLDPSRGVTVIYDPNLADATGTTSIDWYEPSPNGKLVAVSISRGGAEIGEVQVFHTQPNGQGSAKNPPPIDTVTRVNSGTAGGDLAWSVDGKGFYYTRHPHPGERPAKDLGFYQQLYYHELGTPTASDSYQIGRGFPKIAEIEVAVHYPSGRVLLNVQDGDGGEFAHYLKHAQVMHTQGQWQQFSQFGDQFVHATFDYLGDVVGISLANAPRGKIVKLTGPAELPAKFTTLIAESEDALVTGFYRSPPNPVVTQNRIYANYQNGGPTEIRVFDLAGKQLEPLQHVQIANVATVSNISNVGGMMDLGEDRIGYYVSGYLRPTQWYSITDGKVTPSKLVNESKVNFDHIKVERRFATSKDGTQVPVNILRSATAKAAGPLVLTGYGGYGISLTPRFNPANKVLFDQGVSIAIANLRGGGEYGEAWHLAGNLTNKQNVFDDFYAAAKMLIDEKYTTSSQLAIEGSSNGGLLMGATLTQHPQLARCVVSHVGIYDMLRTELSANGVFNIPEFGTVTKPDQFRALHAYSPYHRVKPQIDYPSTLMLTGANDPRVDPMQSRKMTAKLQWANQSANPVLLRTSQKTGHGASTGLSARIAELVDVAAFLFNELGIEYQTP